MAQAPARFKSRRRSTFGKLGLTVLDVDPAFLISTFAKLRDRLLVHRDVDQARNRHRRWIGDAGLVHDAPGGAEDGEGDDDVRAQVAFPISGDDSVIHIAI